MINRFSQRRGKRLHTISTAPNDKVHLKRMSRQNKMWLRISVFLLIFALTSAQDVGDMCMVNNNTPDGICTVVTQCEPAFNEIKNNRRHDFRRCGFSGIQEVVCCPPTTPKFGTTERSSFDTAKRIADRECRKIRDSRIEPLHLHIIGGELASLGEFPHMVALGFDKGDGYAFDCGGSVISRTYVLTAAHCVDTQERIEPTIVRTGVIEIGGSTFNEETDVNIAQTIPHPDYVRREKYDDLALLRLARPLSFSSTLNAVCIDTSTNNPTTPLVVTGWGKASTTKNIRSNMLLKANVTAVASSRCGESYVGWRKLPRGIAPEQLCAGDPNGLRDTCQGDSGGPLHGTDSSDLYTLVGITSFGRGCGSPVPGVYTRVSRYLPWIVSHVWPN